MTVNWLLSKIVSRENNMIFKNYFCWHMMPPMPKKQHSPSWKDSSSGG